MSLNQTSSSLTYVVCPHCHEHAILRSTGPDLFGNGRSDLRTFTCIRCGWGASLKWTDDSYPQSPSGRSRDPPKATLCTSCPRTHKLVRTGIETDEPALRIASSSIIAVYCEHCEKHHRVKVKHTFLLPPQWAPPDASRGEHRPRLMW